MSCGVLTGRIYGVLFLSCCCCPAGSVGGAVGPGRPSSSAKSPAGKAGAASAARAGPSAVSSPRLDGVEDLNAAELEDDDDDLGIMYDPARDDSD
jgi:hypothetical protein